MTCGSPFRCDTWSRPSKERGIVTQLLGWPGQLSAFSSSSIAPFFFFSFFTNASTAFSAHFSSSSPCFHPNSLFTAGLVKENKLVTFMVTLLWWYHRSKQKPLPCSSTTTRVQQIVAAIKSSLDQTVLVLPPFQSSSPRKAALTSPLMVTTFSLFWILLVDNLKESIREKVNIQQLKISLTSTQKSGVIKKNQQNNKRWQPPGPDSRHIWQKLKQQDLPLNPVNPHIKNVVHIKSSLKQSLNLNFSLSSVRGATICLSAVAALTSKTSQGNSAGSLVLF